MKVFNHKRPELIEPPTDSVLLTIHECDQLDTICKQGLVRADQIKELFKKVMLTLKHSMIDLGLHARYKTMETEELYRTQTLDRLLVILSRTRNV